MTMNFKGKATRLDDIDLPMVGREIGVGYALATSASIAACASHPVDSRLCSLA